MLQGSHRLEKYLNIESFLEKSLKTKSGLKSTGESLQCLKKSLNFTIFGMTTLLMETYISIKLVCIYFVQHMLHHIKAQQFILIF